MAKKNNNVAEQLKKFNANIANEEIVETEVVPKKYGFQKKDIIVEPIIISDVPNVEQIPHEKISKDELLQLVTRLQTIQGGLKHDIINGIENNENVEQIREKVLQVHTFDLRIIDEILINL